MSDTVNITLINCAICEALGLDPKKVGSLTIEIEAQKLPVFAVNSWITNEAGKALAEVLSKYELTEKKP